MFGSGHLCVNAAYSRFQSALSVAGVAEGMTLLADSLVSLPSHSTLGSR
jgi:hypothetical protein